MKNLIMIIVISGLLFSACSPRTPEVAPSLPKATLPAQTTSTKLPPTLTATPLPPTQTAVPTNTATPVVSLFPMITFIEDVVCREGPDPYYYPVVNFSTGQTSQVQSRSDDGAWLVVLSQAPNKSTVCWVPVSSVEKFGDVKPLLVSIAPPLPAGPFKATASKGVCGVNRQGAIVVDWSPLASGTGYYVYRNGVNIATVYGNSYIDHDTPGSKTPYIYTYVIQAFNSVGLARVTASVSVTLCD